ncbi:hypothetical protein [Deinococcus soli (ex Cha et al. 2016)]|uniref:Uncharacterized protein n=2 Tax=Deinococcus soli (ex Cha et al. 2016) TaxID=1309411 RepID=A0ACC6KKS7_9DEIO|nr:hypothetical protein [Deinococcus soli (ex Cha et al. 2016)]MDR6218717.1 hypothetical protein [Deinococcus soli (ex Cha et al. 2016)]MDR6328514.1 hypothetical protein [Deinococcus soli (ex Cha et al. 2016)]MDR6753125.1 hypothetical protein [Deinococcus soli (ex Cha et al. 2016)]
MESNSNPEPRRLDRLRHAWLHRADQPRHTRLALRLSATGAFMTCAGLSWDAAQHALNPDLMAGEGLVNLNPSHLLLGGGFALMILGVLLSLVSAARGTPRRTAPAVTAGALAAMAGVTLMALLLGDTALSGSDHHGSHGAASHGDTTGHGDTTVDLLTATPSELLVAQWMITLRQDGLSRTVTRLKAQQNEPVIAQNGHTIAHTLGRMAYTLKPDPAIFTQCNEVFQSGCYHGVLEAHFAAHPDANAQDIANQCRDLSGNLDARYSECLHGLGHGVVGRHGHDLMLALAECRALDDRWVRQNCYSGAFMENAVWQYQAAASGSGNGKDLGQHSHGANHKAAVQPTTERPYAPCDAVESEMQEMCWSYLPNMYAVATKTPFDRLLPYCDAAPTAFRSTCYSSVGKDVAGTQPTNVTLAARTCVTGQPALRGSCYAGAAMNHLARTWTTDRAVTLCAAAPADAQQTCYRQVATALPNYQPDPAARARSCATFGTYAAACRTWARAARPS